MLELLHNRTTRTGEVLKRLAKEGKDFVVAGLPAPRQDFVERGKLWLLQIEELAVILVQDETQSRRELPRAPLLKEDRVPCLSTPIQWQ